MIPRLANKDICTGCSACHDACEFGCIEMVFNNEGFRIPIIDEKCCVDCKRCQQVCPAINESPRNRVKKLFAAWQKDESKLLQSTSGGVFRALAEVVISDGGVVFGAAFDENLRLLHSRADNVENLLPMLGSKYLQSDTGGIFKSTIDALRKGKKVLFSGTPCQIDALYRYMSLNRQNTEDLVSSEIMCHGVCSPNLFCDYVDYLSRENRSKIAKYNFRSKANGWRNMTVSVTYSNGKTKTYRNRYCPYHTWFGQHLSLRQSCFTCKYRSVERVGDITLGDFWSIDKVVPDLDSKKGISAVFINTEKGMALFNESKDKLNVIEIESSRVEQLFDVPIRRNAVKPSALRENFFKDYNYISIQELIEKYPPATFWSICTEKLRSMIK